MFRNPLQTAIVFSILALLVKIIIYLLGVQHGDMERYIVFIYMFIVMLAVFVGIRQNKVYAEKATTFGEDFKVGARTASIFGLLVGVITYFYYNNIDITFFEVKKSPIIDAVMEETKVKLTNEGKAEAVKFLSNQLFALNTMLSPYYQAMVTFMGLTFLGLFDSLLLSFLMKKVPGFKK